MALGYNVLAVDSDVVVLDDWYWRAKQPPLSNYQLLSQAECPVCINGVWAAGGTAEELLTLA